MTPARHEPRQQTDGASRDAESAGWPRRITAALLAALVVCRLLTPTDGAVAGETLWIAQFSLLALVVWAIAEYRTGSWDIGCDWIDGATLLLCLGHVVGALVVVATQGDKRAAWNMLWEWCGVAATYFLMRRLVNTSAARRSLLLVVAATAVVLSALGVWQHFGGYADSRREYEQVKSAIETLERAGRPSDPSAAREWELAVQRAQARYASMHVPGDESARVLWEQRLNSSEPIGLFALANTLAGVLASAAIVWLEAFAQAAGRRPRWSRIIAATLTLLILFCLLLTKSRTAFVGLVFGLPVWSVGTGYWQSGDRRRLRWTLAGGLVVVGGVIAATAAAGGLDRYVVSEAEKSLRYRFEYWQATWRMLRETPRNWLLGVGPGNFRQNYLAFKLPQSSEEIADPHNLLLDVWANGGVMALAGLAGVCLAGVRPLRTAARTADAEQEHEPSWRDGYLAGGMAALPAVYLAGGAGDERILPLWLGWLCVVAVCRTLFRRGAVPVVAAASLAALAIHLLGAGGIGMPGISQLLLLFVVLGGPIAGLRRPSSATTSRWAAAAIGLIGLSLYCGCWFTALMPVSGARNHLAAGEFELFEERRPLQAQREFLLAADADPWSPDPYRQLAQLGHQIWTASAGTENETFEQAIAWQRLAIARDPRSSGGYRELGEMFLAKFGKSGARSDAMSAVEALSRAAELYPNHAILQAELAEALWAAGSRSTARQAAQRARKLDEINEKAGHSDKRLPALQRGRMRQIGDQAAESAN